MPMVVSMTLTLTLKTFERPFSTFSSSILVLSPSCRCVPMTAESRPGSGPQERMGLPAPENHCSTGVSDPCYVYAEADGSYCGYAEADDSDGHYIELSDHPERHPGLLSFLFPLKCLAAVCVCVFVFVYQGSHRFFTQKFKDFLQTFKDPNDRN